MPTQNAILKIDKAGRVIIPKSVRKELQLEPGDALEMESVEGQITFVRFDARQP